MIKRLLQIGIILAGFVSMPGWAILINDGGAYDGTNVGFVDNFVADTGVLSGEAAELAWVNTEISGDTTWTTKTEDVVYYATDGVSLTGDIFAFQLSSSEPDYFLVKNSQGTALYQNVEGLMWGVFNTDDFSGALKLPDNDGVFIISHVSEFGGTVPEPGVIGLLAIGLLGMGVSRRRTKV